MENRAAEMRFRGRSEHTLDPKGRLNIPNRFREILRESFTETLVVTNWQKCLKAFPVPVWEGIEEKLLTEGRVQPGFGNFVRYVISGVNECSLDKQGRILLPAAVRAEFGIGQDVVLNGMLDHFEVWGQSAWQDELRKTRESFDSFASGLSSLGIL